jgi:HlyD family secretion protein
VANLEMMEVLIEVNENDIVRVSMGDTALVEVDAYLNEKFKGVVTQIANSANTVGASADQVTNFEVKVRLLRSSYEHLMKGAMNPFRPGMTATVDIQTKKVKDVPTIEIQAVTTRTDTSRTAKSYRMRKAADETEDADSGDESFEVVFLADGTKAKLQTVKTGVQDDKYIELLSGLKEGDKVIVGPYDIVSKKLKNGSTVKIEDAKKKADESESGDE